MFVAFPRELGFPPDRNCRQSGASPCHERSLATNIINCDVFFLLQQTVEAWRTVFYIAGAVYAFGTIFYGLLGTADTQPWAKPKQSEVLKVFNDKQTEKDKDVKEVV